MRKVSRTLKKGSKTSSCGTTPSRRRASRKSRITSWPMTLITPASGRTKPASDEISVVLPAPFGPSSPKNSPCSISSDTPASACREPKCLTTSTMDTAATMACPSGQGQEVGNAVQFGQRTHTGRNMGKLDAGLRRHGSAQPAQHDGDGRRIRLVHRRKIEDDLTTL